MLKNALLKNYIDWLAQYIEMGRKPTHYYDYPWNEDGWALATGDFTMAGECGANSINIIVLPGYKAHGTIGHNNVYYLGGDGYHMGNYVPVYSDVEFLSLAGIPEFIEAEKVRALEMEKEFEERLSRRCESDVTRFTGR